MNTSWCKNRVILENIRSAYNVWNIIRTADALWWWVATSWYTARPSIESKVRKSSLWAEKTVPMLEFGYDDWNTQDVITRTRDNNMQLICAEITDTSIDLTSYKQQYFDPNRSIAIIFGNEVVWVDDASLRLCDHVVHIPMLWIKSSLNVGQSTAICMRALTY